jgi:3-methyl-2-oxobutanoate hydroxymethyltransferase
VAKLVDAALLVADMPYLSYEVDAREAARNAGRFLKEGGAQAVKIEGGIDILPSLKAIVQCQIPVIGHIGLTPQSIHRMGGYKVQGRKPEDAERILHEAKALENAGACAIVLECVPAELAKHVTHHVQIPTIGIGAGADCDGQVLVSDDMLGLTEGAPRKFVKGFADLRSQALQAMSDYCREVRDGTFPGPEHTFSA